MTVPADRSAHLLNGGQPVITMIDKPRIGPPKDDLRICRKEATIVRYQADIEANGFKNPLRVLPPVDGIHETLTGFTHFLAGCRAGLTAFPCIVLPAGMKTEDALLYRLLDEEMSTALNKIERARAYLTLMKSKGWSQSQLAEALKVKSESEVSKPLSVLAKVATELHEHIASGALPFTHCYEMRDVDHASQVEWAGLIMKGLLSRDALIRRVKAKLGEPVRKVAPKKIERPGITVICDGRFDDDAVIKSVRGVLAGLIKGQRMKAKPPKNPAIYV